jgi:hypothetical protein
MPVFFFSGEISLENTFFILANFVSFVLTILEAILAFFSSTLKKTLEGARVKHRRNENR